MKTYQSNLLKTVSILLLFAMLITSQSISAIALEIIDSVEDTQSAEEVNAETNAPDLDIDEEENIVDEETSSEIQTESTTSSDEDTSVSTSSDGMQSVVEQPFLGKIDEKESVSLNTGTLNYTEKILSLPGINGEKFELNITYDSAKSLLEQYDYQPLTLFFPIAETKQYTYNELRYNLGCGWSFNIPSINHDIHSKEVIVPGKGNYAFNDEGLLNHKLNDIELIDSTPEDTEVIYPLPTWDKTLSFADGKKYYFNENGLLTSMHDRFDNSILFSYVQIGDGWYLSSITDADGDVTTITYADSTNGKHIIITAPDNTQTTLKTTLLDEEEYGEDNYILSEILHSDGERIVFDYIIQDATYAYLKDAEDNPIHYALIEKVEYATGAYVEYEFISHPLKLWGEHLDIQRLSKRSTYTSEDDTEAENCIEYSYYDDYYIEPDLNIEKDDEDVEYSTTVTMWKDGTEYSTEHEFNYKHNCINQKTNVDDILVKEITTEYSKNTNMPQRKTTTIHGSTTATYSETYQYNHSGYIERHSVPTSYGRKSLYYTYDLEYYVIKKIKYYDNLLQKHLEIENTLTSDKKNIKRTDILLYNELVAYTDYEYNSKGQITTKKELISGDPYYTSILGNVSDAIYKTTTYTYDGSKLLSETVTDITDANGTALPDIVYTYTYDTMGRPLTATDPNGNVTRTEYDSRGRVTKVINPDGSYTQYVYNVALNTTTVSASDKETAVYCYDGIGRIEKTHYANGDVQKEYGYDAHGRLAFEKEYYSQNNANTTYYTYDIFDRVTEKKIYDSLNTQIYRETYVYDDAYTSKLALVTKTVHGDENAANIVTKTYTKYGDVVKEEVGGIVTEYEYDYLGNPTRVFYTDADGNEITVAEYTYDRNGNILSETDALGNTRTVTYDFLDRKIAETDFKGNTTEYTYDAMGRLLTMTSPINDTTESVVKYFYDANGNVIKQQQTSHADNTDVLQWNTVEYTYDEMNRVEYIITALDNSQLFTYYKYSDAGMLTDVYTGLTDEWSAALSPDTYSHIVYTYDGRGNNTKITDSLLCEESYQYDFAGNPVSSVMRNGTEFEYEYSPFGIISETVSQGDITLSESNTVYTATGAVRSVTLDGATVYYTYDGTGNVLSETEGDTVKSYTYDSRGRKSGYTLTVDGEIKSQATYAYDNMDRLISVTEGGLTTAYTYDANGNRLSQTTDNVTSDYAYNDANLVISMTNKIGSDVISSFAYTYYTNGNIRTKAETLGEVASNTVYVYDGAGRLVSETKDGEIISYTYDASSNRATMTKDGATTTYLYDGNNRLVSDTYNGITTLYTYDDNGNLLCENVAHTFADGTCSVCDVAQSYIIGDATGDGLVKLLDYMRILKYANGEAYTNTYSAEVTLLVCDIDGNGIIEQADAILVQNYVLNGTSEYPIGTSVTNTMPCAAKNYTYNARGQQTGYTDGFTTSSYTYNPSGLRSSKTVDGATQNFIYNGSFIVYEYDDTSSVTYYYGINRTHNSNGEIYVYNAHGDTVQLVKNGAVTVTYTYDAFGNLTSQIGESDNPFLYCSEYFDEETETYYLRARYYNPANGRFTQEDPIRDGLNWYTYCACNPVAYVDPSGLIPTKEEAAAMAKHIYNEHEKNDESSKDRIVAGWKLIEIFDGGDAASIKLGVYIPVEDDISNPTEYSLVFRGSTTDFSDSETWGVWTNNILAYTSNTSVDLWTAIGAGMYFDATHSQEITFVGHSKGGGEAIAAATATNNNAITFNAANFNFAKYGLTERNKSGITNYYIEGEFLSSLIGMSKYGTNIPVKSQNWNKYSILGFDVKIPDFMKNHSIDTFKDVWNLNW